MLIALSESPSAKLSERRPLSERLSARALSARALSARALSTRSARPTAESWEREMDTCLVPKCEKEMWGGGVWLHG